MSQAQQLYELQETDLDLSAKKEALERVLGLLSGNEELARAEEAHQAEKQALAEVAKSQRQEEWEIEDMRAKSRAMEKKLMGGSISNPKELQGLQQEMASLRQRIRQKEDRVLEFMTRAEEREKAAGEAGTRAEALRQTWEQQRAQLVSEKGRLEADIVVGSRKREELLAALDAAALGLYDFLKVGKGRAVALVEQGRCQGCRITLPLSDLTRVRQREKLVQCSSCERILYLNTQ